jgi:hypothetical protein
MEELFDTASVMAALGGYLEVAELTGSKPKAASNWGRFETFPSNTYVAMIRALREKGKTAPVSLWGMKSAIHSDPEKAESA